MTRVCQPLSVTHESLSGPSSSTTLPSYMSQEQTPPAYDIALHDLTPPQRAFVAQQRNALNQIEIKPSNVNNQTKDPEAQRPIQNAAIRRLQAAVPAVRQQDSQPRGDLQGRYDRRPSLLPLGALLAALLVSWGLVIWLVQAGKPTIPPPYPDQATWSRCEMIIEGHPTRYRLIVQAACLGVAFVAVVSMAWRVPNIRGSCWFSSATVILFSFAMVFPLMYTLWYRCPTKSID
jgi:hypothetical protein